MSREQTRGVPQSYTSGEASGRAAEEESRRNARGVRGTRPARERRGRRTEPSGQQAGASSSIDRFLGVEGEQLLE